jgi:hypothetical protein
VDHFALCAFLAPGNYGQVGILFGRFYLRVKRAENN